MAPPQGEGRGAGHLPQMPHPGSTIANTGGNIQAPTEAGDTTCGVPLGGLLLHHISGPQKG